MTTATLTVAELPPEREMFARGGGWLVRPEHKHMAEVYADLKATLASLLVASAKTPPALRLSTGGRVDFWSLENPHLGPSCQGVELLAGLDENRSVVLKDRRRRSLPGLCSAEGWRRGFQTESPTAEHR